MAVIAISQQVGSRGIELGRLTAEQLGWRFKTGQELIAEAARRFGVSEDELLVFDLRTPHFWERLRSENPGVYESYVDLEPGVWTRMKIVVSGTHAQLYVNGAAQPCLIVNDLKLGKTRGKVALWIGPDTDAYFSNLTIRKP